MKNEVCSHLNNLHELKTEKAHVCETCIQTGDRWVHLRTCQQCGVTLCCDSSPNKHASRHARDAKHPVVSSAEPGERWLWCYVDNQIVSY